MAGLIGLLAAHFTQYEQRRAKHLDAHNVNLRDMKKGLVALEFQVWPISYRAEEFRLERSDMDNSERDEGLGLFFGLQTALMIQAVEKKQATTFLNNVLYRDIHRHFPELWDKLMEIEKLLARRGQFLSLLNEITNRIYLAISESDLDVFQFTYDKGVKIKLKETQGRVEEAYYAGIIFLFVVRESESNWPKKVKLLMQYGLYDGLKAIGNSIRADMNDEIEKFGSLKQELQDKITLCWLRIDEEVNRGKLRGRCILI